MKEETVVSTTPPKLTLNSSFSSSKRADRTENEPEAQSTPPIQLPGAVPFTWEEAPGKPKQQHKSNAQVNLVAEFNGEDEKRLELPPRLSASASERRGGCHRFKNHTSPTSVLDRPSSLFRRAASLRFGRKSSRTALKYWHTGDGASEKDSRAMSLDSSSSSSNVSVSVDEGGEESELDERKVRIMRYRKKKPVLCLASHSASHFLGGVFGRMKHAMVPYRKDHSEC